MGVSEGALAVRGVVLLADLRYWSWAREKPFVPKHPGAGDAVVLASA